MKPIPYHEFEKLSENTFQVLVEHYGFDLQKYQNHPDANRPCTRSQVAEIRKLRRRIKQETGLGMLTGATLPDQLETLYNAMGRWSGTWFALDACSKAFAEFALPIMQEWIREHRAADRG